MTNERTMTFNLPTQLHRELLSIPGLIEVTDGSTLTRKRPVMFENPNEQRITVILCDRYVDSHGMQTYRNGLLFFEELAKS